MGNLLFLQRVGWEKCRINAYLAGTQERENFFIYTGLLQYKFYFCLISSKYAT